MPFLAPRGKSAEEGMEVAAKADGGVGAGAGVPEERRENGRGFDWPRFFTNPYILLQIVLYVYLFYTKLPGVDEVGPLLVWLLLLLPMCVLNLLGTHHLKQLTDKHKREKQTRARSV